MINLPDIPLSLVEHLFPHPDLPVSQFLDFPLPIQLDGTIGSVVHIDTKEFWSEYAPNCLDQLSLSQLMKLPVPSPRMLELCCKDINSPTYQPNIKSIIYTHLPSSHSESDRRFPLWIFNYWLQVSQLRQFVRVPWREAENWAAHQDLVAFSRTCQFCRPYS